MIPELHYFEGLILLYAQDKKNVPSYFKWDHRKRVWSAPAIFYRKTITLFKEKNIKLIDKASNFTKLDLKIYTDYEVRDYQEEALKLWKENSYLGTIVSPTGSGKSLLALKAMETIRGSSFIVLPTIDLMNQWYDLLTDNFRIPIGVLGGGHHEIKDITVSTYESAYIYMNKYGNKFKFLIFDEVHHLPTEKFSIIPEMSIAPYRLGLTATYERQDGQEVWLERLIGKEIVATTIKELKGKHLADFEVIKIRIDLTSGERKQYDELKKRVSNFIKESKLPLYGKNIDKFFKKSVFDPSARRALLSNNLAKKISLCSQSKIELLESLIKRHFNDKIIIFSELNEVTYTISQRFLIPALTHEIGTIERKKILDKFKKGEYRLLAASKVLNEGVDVPDANVGIILSGSGSSREHVQRLGRILRKKEGKKALLYEIVTKGTIESSLSRRRKTEDADVRSLSV